MERTNVVIKKAKVCPSEVFSNLLLASAVLLVLTASLLGDKLPSVVARVQRESWVMVQQTSDHLTSLLK